MPATSRQPNFPLLFASAFAVIALQLLTQYWVPTGQTLNDTDDAMRLVQVRDWLAGQGWFDLHQSRIAGGYESHWSRLIDAGLAGILWMWGLLFNDMLAERLMRAVWPLLWIIPAMAGTAAIAWRIAGRNAALSALLLMAVGSPIFAQFVPGRIDHHNVQIALAVLVMAATVWSDRVRWVAPAAGALTGLALAIGLECLPYLLVCGAVFAVRGALDRTPVPSRYGLALAASTGAAFILSVAPQHWTRGACDEIAVNWLALTVIGGLGLGLVARLGSERTGIRCAQIIVVGLAAMAVFLWIEPRCLRGPYAMMDTAMWPIWLAHVGEMLPFSTLVQGSPSLGISLAAFPLVALACLLTLGYEPAMRGDFGFRVTGAMLVIAIILMETAVKMSAYALWFSIPPVAVLAPQLANRLRVRTFAARLFVSVMLAPAVLSATTKSVLEAATPERNGTVDTRQEVGCFDSANYAALASLPRGLIAADIDFGPFLLALTRHWVISAPYHRLSAGIIATQNTFAAPPADARQRLARLGATYVVMCGTKPLAGFTKEEQAASLWGRLQASDVPDWLERVPLAGPVAVYRVKP